jgi:hypothetical protein
MERMMPVAAINLPLQPCGAEGSRSRGRERVTPGRSCSSGPRASRALMIVSARDARGPEDYEPLAAKMPTPAKLGRRMVGRRNRHRRRKSEQRDAGCVRLKWLSSRGKDAMTQMTQSLGPVSAPSACPALLRAPTARPPSRPQEAARRVSCDRPKPLILKGPNAPTAPNARIGAHSIFSRCWSTPSPPRHAEVRSCPGGLS